MGSITDVRPPSDSCACGCGGKVKPRRRFLKGHYRRFNTIMDIMSRLEIQESGCCLWRGATNRKGGYGTVNYQGRSWKVHRLLYEHFVGPIPPGHDLHHFHCGRANCGNFFHTTPLTHSEHARLSRMPQEKAAKTHCPAGHAYAGANLYLTPSGGRACRECNRISCKRIRDDRRPSEDERKKLLRARRKARLKAARENPDA